MIPYTYLLIFDHPDLPKKYYYGVQYGKNAHPDNLWKTYFSSGKKVHDLIEQYGEENFVFEIRRIFKNPEHAKTWEQKVLQRMKVKDNPDWLNENDHFAPPIISGEKHWLYGKSLPKNTLKKAVQSRQEKLKDPEYKKWLSDIMSNRDFSWITEEWKEKRSLQYKQLYKNRPDLMKRLVENNKGTKNGMYGKTQKESSRQLMSQAHKGKKLGKDNPMFGTTRPDSVKDAISKSRKNKRWIYDPLTRIQKSVDKNSLEVYLAQGWKLGRLKYKDDPDFLLSF